MNNDDVYAADVKRREAQIQGNLDVLSQLFDDDMLWIHASGKVDSKETLLTTLGSGKAKYFAIETRDDTLRIKGNVAFLSGVVTIKAEMGGVQRDLEHRYSIAWNENDRDLKVVNYQSTRLEA